MQAFFKLSYYYYYYFLIIFKKIKKEVKIIIFKSNSFTEQVEFENCYKLLKLYSKNS